MAPELVKTKDGSASLYSKEFDEQYHSVHGALQESRHVFIHAGLQFKIHRDKPSTLSVLEIGFGTGLNTLLTAVEAEKNKVHIKYTAIEKYPVENTIYPQLNYESVLADRDNDLLFRDIYTAVWEADKVITPFFSLRKCNMRIEDVQFFHQFDLIYFDAFAPSAQPELWTKSIFDSMYTALKPAGVLVTYCAKGEVKRIMKSAGFTVERLPGPIGKREMTRAIKRI